MGTTRIARTADNNDQPVPGDGGVSDGAPIALLEQIQVAEVEAARKIANAREAGDLLIAEAHKQAELLRQEAQTAGGLQGQAQCTEAVEKAQAAITEVLARAHIQAEAIRRKGEAAMDDLVTFAVHFVAGAGAEGK